VSTSTLTDDAVRARFPRLFDDRPITRVRRWAPWVLGLVYLAFCFWLFEISLVKLITGIDRMWIVVKSMLVWRDFWSWNFESIFNGLFETLAMAFLGTLLASLLAVPLGFLAAANVVRFAPLRHAVRRVLDLLRGVDQLIWALMYVRAVGLGPLAGVLAIVTSDTGTLAKVYSEAVENVDRKQLDGVKATGAGTLQLYRFGALPQILPVFLSLSLYWFESNTRSATILGIVGAGGIGLQLSERMRANLWDQTAFIILIILVTVTVIDTLSRLIRERFIGKRSL